MIILIILNLEFGLSFAASFAGGLGVDEGVDPDDHQDSLLLDRQVCIPGRTAKLAVHLKKNFRRHGTQDFLLKARLKIF